MRLDLKQILLFAAVTACICDHNNFGCNVEVKLSSVTGWNETVSKLNDLK